MLRMTSTATTGKPADSESESLREAQSETVEQTKPDVSAAEKAWAEEKNKLQEDLKELKVNVLLALCLLLTLKRFAPGWGLGVGEGQGVVALFF